MVYETALMQTIVAEGPLPTGGVRVEFEFALDDSTLGPSPNLYLGGPAVGVGTLTVNRNRPSTLVNSRGLSFQMVSKPGRCGIVATETKWPRWGSHRA